MSRSSRLTLLFACWFAVPVAGTGPVGAEQEVASEEGVRASKLARLDAPLLFVKRHSYSGIHIYDTYYKWPPGGGGIYVLENPSEPRSEWVIRPVIDPSTEETLGEGVYTSPELSWDAETLLFCFKGSPTGNTCVYEIGVDGTGLRQLSDPEPSCADYCGRLNGQHDIMPTYLPDGRIAFLSTRPSGLVPCNNTGVATLHVMNADGSDMHPISVNNVNEFDPCPLPDGRILFGRWEYVDKNALTIQSLWSVNPDGTQETAVFANNMVFPEAILDARPVPGSRLIVGTFAKHNSTPRGSIAMIDPLRGKNGAEAIFNFEHPDEPAHDRGDSCEPWPISRDLVLFSGRPEGRERNVLEMIDRSGQRTLVLSDPEYCLHSPMLVKPRPRPRVIADTVDRQKRSGRFYVQDIYEGLPGIERGDVKWLRVIEETSRVSEGTEGSNPYNQTFLLSSALAFSVKNFLGMVPVNEDGSAYFEVPAGRAVYLQALDEQRRLVQSMRTFVQAAPGTTRSCIGCHEHKFTATKMGNDFPDVLEGPPRQLEPESWGSGYLDYPSMVQPILDRRCVRCHGGTEGFGGGMDLSGGWTEHFNISYENLTNRSRTQLMAYWIAGIDCMNGTALWSSQIFAPRAHGSGAAPLAELLVSGHDGYIDELPKHERDLLLAWIDTNGLYHGTWNRTESGCNIPHWGTMKQRLSAEMKRAGCLECHGQDGQLLYFENDWVNLRNPRRSRLLRAPLAKGGPGLGLAWCRDRKVTADRQRIHLLWNGYAHAVQPPRAFAQHALVEPNREGDAVVSFSETDDPPYQAMLGIIRDARQAALAAPRVDMPGADILPGRCRTLVPPQPPDSPLQVDATVQENGAVSLQWPGMAEWIGMEFEIHRSTRRGFEPGDKTLLTRTPLFSYIDWDAPAGKNHYALRPVADHFTGQPARIEVVVPPPATPAAPEGLAVVPTSGTIHLQWSAAPERGVRYHVYRSLAKTEDFERITGEPIRPSEYVDFEADLETPYVYRVSTVSRRGVESQTSHSVKATARIVMDPVFSLPLAQHARATRHPDQSIGGRLHGKAAVTEAGALDLTQGGHVTFSHDSCFDLSQPLSVTCRVRFEEAGQMPVLLSCGAWNGSGWFLQRLGNQWRWYVGGSHCDGGQPEVGEWFTLAATFDGRRIRLFENGNLVAEKEATVDQSVWPGDLHVGQYSNQPTPDYQVTGQIKDVKIYHRALANAEVRQAAKLE
ncbi:MAG: LamG-like jellyroll fold domain-containing protein [Planctomycetota bacterium]